MCHIYVSNVLMYQHLKKQIKYVDDRTIFKLFIQNKQKLPYIKK